MIATKFLLHGGDRAAPSIFPDNRLLNTITVQRPSDHPASGHGVCSPQSQPSTNTFVYQDLSATTTTQVHHPERQTGYTKGVFSLVRFPSKLSSFGFTHIFAEASRQHGPATCSALRSQSRNHAHKAPRGV